MTAAGWFISFSTAFLLGYSRHVFEPFANEFYSILQIAAYLFCFSAGAMFQPSRKSKRILSEQLLFTILFNLLAGFLLSKSIGIESAAPLLFLIAGRITGQLKNRIIFRRNYLLTFVSGAACGMLVFYLVNNRISSRAMEILFFCAWLPPVLIPVLLIRQLKASRWFKLLLAAGWLLIPAQYILHPDRPILQAKPACSNQDAEIKPAAVVQAQLQPNRKNLKILLIGDNHSMIRQLSMSPLTRKLSSLSLTAGKDIYRKLNAEADDYDLIVLLLPLPQSLYAERLYSIRFYQILKDHLAEDGVLAVWLPEDLLSYRKNYLNEIYGCTGAVLCKVFPQVKPSCADSLVLLCGGKNLANSPSELDNRAEKLLSGSDILPEKVFLMSTPEEQLEQERFFRTEIFRSGGHDGRTCRLLWNAVRNHPLPDRTILGGIIDYLRGRLLYVLGGLTVLAMILRYFYSGGTANKRVWMTCENGICTGLLVMLFLIPYQQYTGRLSCDWVLLTGFFLFCGFFGMLVPAGHHHSSLVLKLLLGMTLLLPLCGFAFLNGYSPEPLVFHAAVGIIGFTAGAVYANIGADILLIPAGLAAGLVLGIILFWLPGGTVFAMILAVLTRIAPVCAENLQKQFDKTGISG